MRYLLATISQGLQSLSILLWTAVLPLLGVLQTSLLFLQTSIFFSSCLFFGQSLAVHAPQHAAIDALFERNHLIVDQHGKTGEGGDEGGGEGLEPGVEMAVRAGEVVSRVALRLIGCALADLACGVDDQRMAVPNAIAFGSGRQIGEVARVPIRRPAPN